VPITSVARSTARTVLVTCLLALAAAPPAHAESTALDRYLASLTTLQADFQQQVIDSHDKVVERGMGKLWLQRPGKLRWDYHLSAGLSAGSSAGAADADSGQLLIADGRQLWFYDRELAQVTVRAMDDALSASPMVLLSGTPAQIAAAFEVSAIPAQDGAERVQVTPRNHGADFSRAELSFKGGVLTTMRIHDKLGQVAVLQFSGSVRNGGIAAGQFSFTAPPGVDVIGKSQ
jgi:outer membrane lipoprotein carrier protein